MRLTMPTRFMTITAFSQSAWKYGSFFSRSTGPKPCLPPRSCTPFMMVVRGGSRGAGNLSSSLSARQLDGVAQALELVCDAFAMIALDLDGAVLDRAAGAAEPLELRGASLEILARQATDHRNHLAIAPGAVAEDAHDAVARHSRISGSGRTAPRLHRSKASLLGRVDGAAVLHGGSVADGR